MTDLVLAGGVLGCVVWLAVLTGRYRQHLRSCVDGEPVYRRLPDGRCRFSWMVIGQLARAGAGPDQDRPGEIR